MLALIGSLDWVAILVAIGVGQVVSTVWFVVLFGEPWARAYGAADKKQHAKEIPPYTYAVQVLCTAFMAFTLALFFRLLGVRNLEEALLVVAFVALGFCVATGLPGYAFLKRWKAAGIALGCQVVMLVAMGVVLAVM